MATVVDCADPVALLPGMRAARTALAHGELVVVPTDTVYGIAADAFDAGAVQRLLDAKGRGRQAPPPVLVPTRATLDALAEVVPPSITVLADAFWPGPLTIVLPARSSLAWDLGETGGTVALRMPNQRIVLELLAETGPLAVSSANLTGQPAATNVEEAHAQLGESVKVYLDGGATPGPEPSTIVDATALADGTGPLRILRVGVISEAQLRDASPEAFQALVVEPAVEDVADEPEPSTEEPVTDEPPAARPAPAPTDSAPPESAEPRP
ncbi:L-threonylcarbamoyladenylate synthase [uncultured Amnibacterium sp.]|uniref:L-threonylcarbamoyladenylate synthase n=1 Tax=uncultured Amnibacterium sp. TaxID=1631851 RepID=UPI0035CA7311